MVNTIGRSEILTAFLESLIDTGYIHSPLLDYETGFYVISRQEDNKLGLVSENGWFDGKTSGKSAHWFEAIDSQEVGEKIYLELRNQGEYKAYELSDGKIIPRKNIDFDIADVIGAILAKQGGVLN